jgi:hypothetical protein
MEDGILGIEGNGPVDLLGGEDAGARRAGEPVEDAELAMKLGVLEISFDAFLEVGDIPPHFAFFAGRDGFQKIALFYGAAPFRAK